MKRRGMSKILAFTVSLALITSNMSVFAKEASKEALEKNNSEVQQKVDELKKQLLDEKEEIKDTLKDPEELVRVIVETNGKSAMERSSMPTLTLLSQLKMIFKK